MSVLIRRQSRHLFSGELDGGALSHGERQLAAEHEGALNHLPGVRVQPPGGPFRLHQARGARRCLLLLHRQEPLQQRVAGGKGFLLGAQVPQLLRQLSHTLLAVLQLALLPRPVPLLGGAVLLLEPAQLLRRPRPPAPRLLALGLPLLRHVVTAAAAVTSISLQPVILSIAREHQTLQAISRLDRSRQEVVGAEGSKLGR
mmetsp:Transcript_20496/g.61698  ORF Transcript_20496/g.61698 Transcript_20496/m.61698 type:complete len:200 (+) Transcript_20496:3531-4130(+)